MTSFPGLRIPTQAIRMGVAPLKDGTCPRLLTTLYGSDNWILRYLTFTNLVVSSVMK